jgi:hypothetical protein
LAGRHPIHSGNDEPGGLAPIPHVSSLPLLSQRLLPYERQLIQQLGCTETEYLHFKQQVQWLSRERPAEYAGVPDVRNEPTAVILFVVGLALQAVSYFLAPKPDMPQQRQIQNRNLDSIAGRDRFAPTYGFQTAQELSRYNETIPIVFTKQQQIVINGSLQYVGGIMISPKLVWSRMYSWGSYQSLEMVFLAGQSPMPRGPYGTAAEQAADRSGVYLGQTPLDSFTDNDYSWYFYQGGYPSAVSNSYFAGANTLRQSADSRLRGHNRRYGLFGAESAEDNAFDSPTVAGLLTDQAFSHAFSPASQLRFGTYNGLPNGTPYRLNFEVINYTFGASSQTLATASAKLVQMTGTPQWEGTGRNYARQFGIIRHNGTEYPAPTRSNGTRVEVNVGDTIDVIYNVAQVTEKINYDPSFFTANAPSTQAYRAFYTGSMAFVTPDVDSVDNKSIQNAIKTEHEQQDDLLKLGSKWLIGNCMWEVTSRDPSDKVFDKTDTSAFQVQLTCRTVYGDGGPGYVGICDKSFVTTTTHLPEGPNGPLYDIGQAWFPLCKAEIATFQNTRSCEVTEIGIKSNVWNRFQGICNFNSIPAPYDKAKYDVQGVALSTGTIQAYGRRASFFNLYVRPANNSYGFNEGWAKLNPFPMCVVGSTPQDQFNFIRVAHSFDQYEYRIRPITSGEITQIIGKTTEVDFQGQKFVGPCIRLNASGANVEGTTPELFQAVVTTEHGTFTLYTRAVIASLNELALNTEMVSAPAPATTSPAPTPTPIPSSPFFKLPLKSVRFIKAYIPKLGRDATVREISNGITRAINKDPDPNTDPFPVPTPFFLAVNQEYAFSAADKNAFKYSSGAKQILLDMQLRIVDLGVLPDVAGATRTRYWTMINGDDVPATFTGTWQADEQFIITSRIFGTAGGLDPLGLEIEYVFAVNKPTSLFITPTPSPAPSTSTGRRVFETNSGIAEVSHYGSLISRSCDNGPEHEITYINESLANDVVRDGIASYTGCAMAGLKLRSSINISSVEQLHLYQKNGVVVTTLRRNAAGAVVESSGPSNVFTDLAYFMLTNRQTGAGELVSADLIDITQFARTAVFLERNNLFFDDVITEPVNLREYIGRISASLLCNLVIRGGKFSIEPALPIDEQSYSFYDVKVPISGIFTEGNIIEDSFQLEYVPAQDRLPIRALVRYRTELPNRFPQEQTTVVYYTDQPNGPLEEYNFTHITSRHHAELFAKYALSARRHRTHSVTFRTLPYGLALAPGDFIRVVTKASYVQPDASGIIKDSGEIITPATLTDGQTLNVYYWDKTDSQITESSITVTIKNGAPYANRLFNTIFAVKTDTTRKLVYMVEAIDLDTEGLAQITASYFPVDSNDYSIVAQELKPSYTGFTVVSDLSPD